jgi:hypothetical protein
MTTTYSQTVLSPWLTPVRLVSVANIAGTYYNGPNNNGVGATLTIAASSLTIDSVACAVGDRVLLQVQTNTYEQGVYVVSSIGSTVVLTRSGDMQAREQMKAGQYVSVGAGSVRAGNFYSLVEPLPNNIGVDALVFNADPSAGGVSFSGGASTANALAVFADTAGNLKAATGASTFGQDLAVTGALSSTTFSASGNITSTAGLYIESVLNGITALAGGAQAGTALTRQINRVTTVTTAADSVQLPAATAGKVVTVINAAAANAMAVFPQTGEIINALAANASISVAANKTIMFFCAVAGTWNSLLTA